MSYRATRKYFPDLLIQTKDTDPDLRFMALNDLEKEIVASTSSVSYTDLIKYSNTLLKCLDDEFVEVRTQSLKCFETIASKLKLDVLPLIKELMERNKKPKKVTITSTIYTMALHNLLKNFPHIEKVYVDAIEIIVPQLLSSRKDFYLEIDYIEILTDVCEYMSKYLTNKQIIDILLFLNDAVFDADTIIAKKSIVTCNILLRNVTEPTINSTYLKHVIKNYNNYPNKYDRKIKLLLTLSGCISANPTLFQTDVTFFSNTALNCLQLNKLNVVDEDYEEQKNKDDVRIESLVLFNKLFGYCMGENVESLIPTAFEICQSFITYDPYNDSSPEEEEEEEEPDEEEDYYSDDDGEYGYEQDDDDDEDNNSAWKLRVESLSLLITIITKFPAKLPLVFNSIFAILLNNLSLEKHTIVVSKLVESLSLIFELSSDTGAFYNILRSKELNANSKTRRNSDFSLYTAEDPYAYLSCHSTSINDTILQFIEKSTIFVNDKPELVISLVSNWVNTIGKLNSYVETFVVTINEAWKTQTMRTNIFIFYSVLLKNNSLADFGCGLQYLVAYLEKSLSDDSNHRLVNESLNLLTRIYDTSESGPPLQQISITFAPLLIKRVLNRNVSTEIRLQSLNILVLILTKTEIEEGLAKDILDIFNETLSTEVLAFSSLNFLVKFINSSKEFRVISSCWIKSMLKYSFDYLNISDLALSAIKVISSLFGTGIIDEEDCKNALIAIEKLHLDKRINENNCVYIGIILTQVLNNVNVVDNLNYFLSLLFDLTAFDEFDEVLVELMSNLIKHTPDQAILKAIHNLGGDETDINYSKLLAVLSVTSGNTASVKQMLGNLDKNQNVYFSLKFLNQVSKSYDLGVGVTPFVAGFGSSDQAVVNVTIKLVATIVSNYPDKYLGEFLDLLSQAQNLTSNFKALIIILEKVDLNNSTADEILQIIITTLNKRGNGSNDEAQYKAAAQCIGELIVKYDYISYALNILSIALTENQLALASIAESAKFVFSNINKIDDSFEASLLIFGEMTTRNLMLSTTLKLKEIGISNLNLILSKKPSIAITLINDNFEELIQKEAKPDKEFIHTQFIGPYKHKIDDALNYRRQVFEFIYYLLKTLEDNNTLVLLTNIDWRLCFNKYFDSGIKDDQSIASVCLLTTLKILELQNTLFTGSNPEVDVFELFLTRCRKTLNKKLSDTAVKQDIEKQNNLVKMVVRFLKKVDIMILNETLNLNSTQFSTWTSFIKETKTKFPTFESELHL